MLFSDETGMSHWWHQPNFMVHKIWGCSGVQVLVMQSWLAVF